MAVREASPAGLPTWSWGSAKARVGRKEGKTLLAFRLVIRMEMTHCLLGKLLWVGVGVVLCLDGGLTGGGHLWVPLRCNFGLGSRIQ